MVLNHEQLKKNVSYDPETGIFTRLSTNKSCGSNNGNGYLRIKINGKGYLAHRLAIYFIDGVMPENEIDHINGNTLDNRLMNLRIASSSKNLWNAKKPSSNKTGYKGIYLNQKTNRWRATISINNKRIHLGYYKCKEEAARAYIDYAKQAHGEFFYAST